MLDERKEAERQETKDFLDLVVDELKEKPVLDENFCLGCSLLVSIRHQPR